MQQQELIYSDLRDLPDALEILQDMQPIEHGILSVTLDTSVSRIPGREFLLFFRDAARSVRSELEASDPTDLKQFDASVDRVDYFLLHRLAPRHPGLVLFASTDPDFLMAVPLASRPEQDIAWGKSPLLTPVIEALDEHERVAVALVDKQHARLFTVYLGELKSHGAFESELTGRHAAGDWPYRTRSSPSRVREGRYSPGTGGMIAWSGMAQSRQLRRHEEYALQHVREVASALMELRSRLPFDRLILAGPEEATVMLQANLPRPLESRYAGSLAMPIHSSEADILAETLRAAETIEREAELTDVERLIEGFGTRRAVVGLEATLEALSEGRIDRLIIASGDIGDIWACPECGQLASTGPACPLCSSQLEHVDDARERLIVEVLNQSGRIEMVSGPAAELLIRHGGVGAYTRF